MQGGVRHRPRGTGVVLSVTGPFVLFIFLQFVALVFFIAGATHAGPARELGVFDTLGRVCSGVAWLVLSAGVARLVIKLRAARAQRRRAQCQ